MELINDFYYVLESSGKEGSFSASIKFNPDHRIYSGHFPGFPATPGVIFLQIVHELVEKDTEQKVQLISITQCKFLKLLNPNETSQVTIHIDLIRTDGLLKIKARGENNLEMYFRLDAVYQPSHDSKSH